MSAQKIDLALAFLQSRPDSAAAVLEQQPAENVAAFLCDVPGSQAAAVLKRMLPQYIAAVCRQLEPSVSARFLSEMDTGLVAAVLRRFDSALSRAVLERLPERIKMACRLLLRYSADAVGAWMVVDIMTLPVDCTAAEACTRLASGQGLLDSDAVHVVDRDGRLQGVIGITRLLSAAPDTAILSIATKNPEALSGRAALLSVVDHPVWVQKDTVAVLNRKQQIVGMLRHVDLRRGLDEVSGTRAWPGSSDALAGFLDVYGTSLLALFGAAWEAGGTRRPQGENR